MRPNTSSIGHVAILLAIHSLILVFKANGLPPSEMGAEQLELYESADMMLWAAWGAVIFRGVLDTAMSLHDNE